ncbi:MULTISPECIES: daunorubicin resistance protein DrrA family ABC transporter ATP-binding protein [Streptomyces]|uniref:Daunorubicin resistance protein DrrA family ABC transporter ATP-binding protein n=2 Tax=Streptomyces rochei group TaxID=2867164 RepID=A0ABW7DVD4_STRRO|nr:MULTISPECIES: daunorubicin resistance protein DrrA family ABC transporter ATP-binding protein [Streptomyces]MBQ0913423.1 daunorubicin resistance protein DrrA family ABC transporter ATP-binding protein [Streptomyces sp. RM99]PVD09654.1 daunorubicin resistance protein DrrA family ABC transporter ATP-binding protein [Streptomyces sp. CS207]RSS21657.1 daunorubicin resistance protein DrrA family ABC transporter ATP-binding protein [Streptomyces sp. WAC05458]UXI77999.1 daunorubicin resistance prot
MTTTYAVLSEGLEKRFGEVRALRGLDLAVAEGTVCGLLGPNGAGKTTAVRLLTTLLRPDAGSARVAGHDLVREAAAVRRRIGVTGQYASVDGDLTGRQNLRLFARLHRLRDASARADELLDRFGLTEAADRPASTFSGGMRRRLDLAASLVRRPEVLFLDEPTTGLDPASRNRIWDAVRALKEEGTTVLLTTQYLEEADRLADDIALVDRGRVAHTGSPAELKALVGAYAEVVVADTEAMGPAAAVLDRLTGTEPVLDPDRCTVGAAGTDPTLTLPRLVRELDAAGVPLLDASLRPPTLDDVFLRLTGENKEVAA